jgi:heat-inducible transcriptional repressor
MGAAGALVHPAVKAIYETMSEVDTADIKVDGVNKLLNYPEYSDVSELRDLLGVLEEKDRLMDVISTQATEESDGIHVYIGAENSSDAMKNTTLIFKDVYVGGKKLSVGVIGPKRMNYSKVIDMINRLTFGIDRMFNEEPGLPEPKDKY